MRKVRRGAGQRVSIKYGNDVETRYRYDPERRWLSGIETKNRRGQSYQDITYALDAVGNVKAYKNEGGGFTTKQEYRYDDLYQLVEVTGTSKGSGELGLSYYESNYRQEYRFNGIGNMTVKVSEERHPGAKAPGDQLNYTLDYDYIQGTHKASRIGNRYYGYDRNGNVTAEQDGSPVTAGTGTGVGTVREEGGGVYSTDYGFALRNKQQGGTATGGVNRREYEWNERNLLKRSADGQWDVQYRYGADGQRAVKYSASGALREETLYFNKMFQITKVGSVPSTESKHIYVGEVRIATKQKREGNVNLEQEGKQQYYYHGDHLGSAQLVTDWKGDLYEHLEYAPYGELWIDRAAMDVGQNATPFRFTGKERDKETGLYYYGARYLDPKTSRWISGDPALGEYVPQAPINDEARKYNKNLPGMGGVFNTVNLHVYHYAGNNPVVLTDPDGRIIITPSLLYKQKDTPYSEAFLGGEPSYDDAAGKTPNTIGRYGCLYMAASSMGHSILADSRGLSAVLNILDALCENKPENFKSTEPGKGKHGGTDVNLLDNKVKDIIQNISGKKIGYERITKNMGGNMSNVLKALAGSSKSFYVIVEFQKGDAQHFIAIDGITINQDGTIKLNYREQYINYPENFFNSGNINSLVVIWVEN